MSVRKLPKTRAKSDNHSFPLTTVLTGKKEKNNVEISLRRKTVLYNSLCPDKSKTASFSASLLISAKERVKNFFPFPLWEILFFFSATEEEEEEEEEGGGRGDYPDFNWTWAAKREFLTMGSTPLLEEKFTVATATATVRFNR